MRHLNLPHAVSMSLAGILLAGCSLLAPEPTATPVPPTVEPTATAEPGLSGEVEFEILPYESKVTYSVGEVFLGEENRPNVAQGTTDQVTGTIVINFDAPEQSSAGVITANIEMFFSDRPRRDRSIRAEWLESGLYPLATLEVTRIEGSLADAQEGEDVPLKVTGDLTVRDVTREVTFEGSMRLDGERLSGEMVTDLLMTDFGFEPPFINGFVKVENEVEVTVVIVAAAKAA